MLNSQDGEPSPSVIVLSSVSTTGRPPRQLLLSSLRARALFIDWQLRNADQGWLLVNGWLVLLLCYFVFLGLEERHCNGFPHSKVFSSLIIRPSLTSFLLPSILMNKLHIGVKQKYYESSTNSNDIISACEFKFDQNKSPSFHISLSQNVWRRELPWEN